MGIGRNWYGFLEGNSLLVLILSWNLSSTWSFCPPFCACDDIALSVNCQSASNLSVVPIFLNPQIKYLSLARNQIKDITLSLQFYAELNFLDISLNSIESLGKQNFESLKYLKMLNVSYNSMKSLETGIFTGLTSLEVLDLTGNQVQRVEREIFWNLKSIKEIILDRNRLEFIDWDLFRGLDTLQSISVQFNFIQVIEPSATLGTLSPSSGSVSLPWTLKNVRKLDVSANQLTRVKDYSLAVFQGLTELNLCCNYIHTLEQRAFSANSKTGVQLVRLNLSQNRLGRIPTDSFVPVGPSLRELDLSSNRISDEIPKGAFTNLYQLQNLKLSDNPALLSIHPEALADNVNLIQFEADYLSNLTEVSGTLLENKPNLEYFSLKYAHVATLPPQMLEDPILPAIRALDLTGNPVECNCSIFPLFHFLQDQSDNDEGGSHNHHHSPQPMHQPPPQSPFTNLNSNLSQALYIDPSIIKSKSSSSTSRPATSYLSRLRCQSPVELTGILVKDLKDSDFGECFGGEDNFEFLVICIAGTILCLILLAIGIKVCCACGGCRRVANFCKNHHCCHRLRRSSTDKNINDKPDNKFFDSMNGMGGVRRELPEPPTLITNTFLHPQGKFNMGPPPSSTSTSSSPSHHHHPSNQPQHLYLSSNNIVIGSVGGVPLALPLQNYNNGGYVSSGHLQHHHNTLRGHYDEYDDGSRSSGGGGGRMSPKGNSNYRHPHTTSNGHLEPNYPSYSAPNPPVGGCGPNAPVILHYDYEYPSEEDEQEYHHHHHSQMSTNTNKSKNNTKGSAHRVKHVPSVLV